MVWSCVWDGGGGGGGRRGRVDFPLSETEESRTIYREKDTYSNIHIS